MIHPSRRVASRSDAGVSQVPRQDLLGSRTDTRRHSHGDQNSEQITNYKVRQIITTNTNIIMRTINHN